MAKNKHVKATYSDVCIAAADPEVMARFWALIEKTDGCWLWRSPRSKAEYGCFHVAYSGGEQRRVSAHRFMWMILHGAIADGQMLCEYHGVALGQTPREREDVELGRAFRELAIKAVGR